MKRVLLKLIQLYWIIIPENKRRSCLFRETCSLYIYRHTSSGGFINGMIAFRIRLKKCKRGYKLYSGPNGFEMELSDGTVIFENEIGSSILEGVYKDLRNFEKLHK